MRKIIWAVGKSQIEPKQRYQYGKRGTRTALESSKNGETVMDHFTAGV